MKRSVSFRRDERGSLVMETAAVLPLFLIACWLFAWLLLAARTEAALQDAVDEAVKATAAHAYPLELAFHAYRNDRTVQQAEQLIEQILPYPIRAMLENNKQQLLAASGGQAAGARWSNAQVHEMWVVPFLMQFADEDGNGRTLLKADRLAVRGVLLPTFADDSSSYFGIAASYRLPFPIPFVRKEIVFSASAVERCWVGDK